MSVKIKMSFKLYMSCERRIGHSLAPSMKILLIEFVLSKRKSMN